MKISTNSWHYKLADLATNGYVPENLCAYFWKVMGGLAIVSLMTIIVLAALFILFGAFVITSALGYL